MSPHHHALAFSLFCAALACSSNAPTSGEPVACDLGDGGCPEGCTAIVGQVVGVDGCFTGETVTAGCYAAEPMETRSGAVSCYDRADLRIGTPVIYPELELQGFRACGWDRSPECGSSDGGTPGGGALDGSLGRCEVLDGGGCTGPEGTSCCEVTGRRYHADAGCLGPIETVGCFAFSDALDCGGCGAERCYTLDSAGTFHSSGCWPSAYAHEQTFSECPTELYDEVQRAPTCAE